MAKAPTLDTLDNQFNASDRGRGFLAGPTGLLHDQTA
jgi:hypothetical protein